MRLLILLAFWCFCISHVNIAKADNSLIIYTEQFPPYNFKGKDQIKGINIDLVAEICVKAGLRCYFRLLPWSRAMSKTLATETSGLVSTSRLPAREHNFHWVGPLVSSRACIYKLKDRDDIQIDGKDTLLQYTLGVTRNDVYEKILISWGFKAGINYLTYSKKFEEIRMFKLKKHDLILASPLVMKRQFSKYDISIDDLEPVYEVQDDALKGNYLALNKAVPDALISKLQNALDTLKKSGFVSKTIRKYETSPLDRESDSKTQNHCLNSYFRF
jgi:polar amino acid transport system substrate-binding protein